MFDDDSARRALHTIADEPAPPATTTIDQVLRRGRRRVFVQRAAAAAGVMAVVAAIGVSAVLLRGDTTQTAAVPPPTPTTASSYPPDFRQVTRPANMTDKNGKFCLDLDSRVPPAEPDIDLLPETRVSQAYKQAILDSTGNLPSTVSTQWMPKSPKHDAPRGYIVTEIPAGGGIEGNGQVQLEAGRYGGTPTQMADLSLTVYGNCESPARLVAADGTVFQLYPEDRADTAQPVQHLQIYLPDQRFYVITSAGYSTADLKQGTGGRGRLPTTQDQLAKIGQALVANLG